MRIIALAVLAAAILTIDAQAGIFGPSDQEIKETLVAYFDKPDVSLAELTGIDLAALQNDRHAYVLKVQLGRLVGAAEKALGAEEAKLESLEKAVERYFVTLYTEEVHDEFYHEIRPSKQAAYRKSLADAKPQRDKVAAIQSSLAAAAAVESVLKRISKDFKELPMPRSMVQFRKLHPAD